MNSSTMLITSPSFKNSASIPRKFTCEGGDINPELQIQNVPERAVSLVLIMHDPDAPTAGGFTHWLVWNINPGTSVIKEESVPPGAAEGRNGAGRTGYLGPCPHTGTHRYEFRLHALDATLDLPATAPAKELEAAIAPHLIEEAVLVGTYQKSSAGLV